MDDLRVIVLPFESIMSGVWLVLQIYTYCKFQWYVLTHVLELLMMQLTVIVFTLDLQGQLQGESKFTFFLKIITT